MQTTKTRRTTPHSTKPTFRQLTDGTARGVGPTLFRALARTISVPYSNVVRLRNRLYDARVFRVRRADRPTISIGNLTLGGVGKTPFVGWLTEFFLDAGRRPGLISRGYRADAQRDLFAQIDARAPSFEVPPQFERFARFNDEARELALRFPSVPHFLSPNRLEAAAALTTVRPETDVLILDDAFQHRRIARDLNVVLLDALDPFGGGRVFPAGFLREPASGLARADVVLLNRADLIAPQERDAIRRRVERFAPRAFWAEIAQTPRRLYGGENLGGDAALETKRVGRFVQTDFATWKSRTASARRFVAFCGLGAPSGFRRTLAAQRLNVAAFEAFPDHCAYGPREFSRLERLLDATGADAMLTTTKDCVKIGGDLSVAGRPVFAVGIGVEFLSNEREFRALLTARFLSDATAARRAA